MNKQLLSLSLIHSLTNIIKLVINSRNENLPAGLTAGSVGAGANSSAIVTTGETSRWDARPVTKHNIYKQYCGELCTKTNVTNESNYDEIIRLAGVHHPALSLLSSPLSLFSVQIGQLRETRSPLAQITKIQITLVHR